MCDNSRRHSCASRMQIKVVTREIPLVLKWMRGYFIFQNTNSIYQEENHDNL